jgi:hypothetical protein
MIALKRNMRQLQSKMDVKLSEWNYLSGLLLMMNPDWSSGGNWQRVIEFKINDLKLS